MRLPRNLEEPWIMDRLVWRALAERQRAERKERLDRGAWRIGAAQRPVQKRLGDRFVEIPPGRRIDAVDEEVRIESRLRHECEDVARIGVHRDERAAAVTEGGFGDLLKRDIERKRQ